MRLLITIGMIVIFISAFFIIFTIDSIVKNDLNCLTGESGKTVCNLDDVGMSFIIKTMVIGFFILLSIVSVYLIMTNVMPQTAFYVKRGEEKL